MHRSPIPIAVLFGALIAFAGNERAFADSPSVTAVLSNSEAVVGEMVELQIKVSGSRDARPPEDIVVNGSGDSRHRDFAPIRNAQFHNHIKRDLQLQNPAAPSGSVYNPVADSPGRRQIAAHTGADAERRRFAWQFLCFSPNSRRATGQRRASSFLQS